MTQTAVAKDDQFKSLNEATNALNSLKEAFSPNLREAHHFGVTQIQQTLNNIYSLLEPKSDNARYEYKFSNKVVSSIKDIIFSTLNDWENTLDTNLYLIERWRNNLPRSAHKLYLEESGYNRLNNIIREHQKSFKETEKKICDLLSIYKKSKLTSKERFEIAIGEISTSIPPVADASLNNLITRLSQLEKVLSVTSSSPLKLFPLSETEGLYKKLVLFALESFSKDADKERVFEISKARARRIQEEMKDFRLFRDAVYRVVATNISMILFGTDGKYHKVVKNKDGTESISELLGTALTEDFPQNILVKWENDIPQRSTLVTEDKKQSFRVVLFSARIKETLGFLRKLACEALHYGLGDELVGSKSKGSRQFYDCVASQIVVPTVAERNRVFNIIKKGFEFNQDVVRKQLESFGFFLPDGDCLKIEAEVDTARESSSYVLEDDYDLNTYDYSVIRSLKLRWNINLKYIKGGELQETLFPYEIRVWTADDYAIDRRAPHKLSHNEYKARQQEREDMISLLLPDYDFSKEVFSALTARPDKVLSGFKETYDKNGDLWLVWNRDEGMKIHVK